MGAIVCRNCHFAHEGPCKRQPVHTVETQRIAPLPCAECAIKDVQIRALESALDKLESHGPAITGSSLTVESNGFDKKSYQREYMRKRRERSKAT